MKTQPEKKNDTSVPKMINNPIHKEISNFENPKNLHHNNENNSNARKSLNYKENISKYQTPKFFDILDDKNKFCDNDPNARSKFNNNKDFNLLCRPKKKENMNQNRSEVDFEIINYSIKNPLNHNYQKGNFQNLNQYGSQNVGGNHDMKSNAFRK